jgi:alkanesulfonate monooxygenase SsuD/methylene tetrahydromethanopterin reductase-like flavin-dependent oxidoreductase (luciferase family)
MRTNAKEPQAMARRNVYIRDEDEDVWERAEKLAGGAPMSRVITETLRAYVSSREGNPMQRLTIGTMNGGQEITKAFIGRWLIAPDEAYRSEHEGDASIETQVRAGTTFAVADTAKGHILVYVDAYTGRAEFDVYDDFDQAEERGIPGDVLTLAAKRAGIERAELLDI